MRPTGSGLRGHGGRYVATEQTMERTGRIGRGWDATLRFLIGKRLHSEAEAEERIGVATGLPILASDNVSSSAYATEEAMRILAIAGGAALALTMPIALAVVFVLAIVVLSESRVIRAYPNGGGSYLVARENHGVIAGLVAAAALLIDYVLTVSVSTAAGVAAISSFVPELHDHRVAVGVVLIAVLAVGNLRGVREAGLLFAAPTYAYMLAMYGLLAFGLFRIFTGDVPAPVAPPDPFPAEGTAALSILLVLRAFASGSVGLTGSEAVANGVPSFRRPETRNAVNALVPLYTIGVFLAFTLSQSGLVRRWRRLRNPGWRLSMAINSFGAVVTGTVLTVVAVTKFALGAWMVMVLIPVIVGLLYAINRHYQTTQDALVISATDQRVPVYAAPVVIVPIARLDRAALQALAFARSVSPTAKAVHVSTSRASADEFRARWNRLGTDVALDVLESS